MREKMLVLLATIVAWMRGLADREIPHPDAGGATAFAGDTRAKTSGQIAATGAAIVSTGGLSYLIKNYLIGGTLYQVSRQLIELVGNLGSITTIIGTFFGSINDLIAAAIPAEIILAGVRVSSRSLGPYGIAAFVVAVAATIAGVWLLIVWIRNVDWSPIGLFFGGRE